MTEISRDETMRQLVQNVRLFTDRTLVIRDGNIEVLIDRNGHTCVTVRNGASGTSHTEMRHISREHFARTHAIIQQWILSQRELFVDTIIDQRIMPGGYLRRKDW